MINIVISHLFPAKGAWNSSVQSPAWCSLLDTPVWGSGWRKAPWNAHRGQMHPLTQYKCTLSTPLQNFLGKNLAALPSDESLSRKWGNELPNTELPCPPRSTPVLSQKLLARQVMCSHNLWQLELLTLFPFGETFIKYYNQFNCINTLEPLSSPQWKTQYFSITSSVWSDIDHGNWNQRHWGALFIPT